MRLSSARLPGLLALPLLLVALHLWGNATRGYIATDSALVWWAAQWFNPGSDLEHAPLLLLLAAGLGVWNWRRHPQLGDTPQPGRAAGWLAAAFACLALGIFTQQTRLSLLAMLLGALGTAWAAGGTRGARAAAFPLGLLLFAFPWTFVMDEVGFQLRLAVIEVARVGCGWVGLEVVQRGTLLTPPDGGYAYDLAPACSGTRSLLVLAALCLIIGYISFRSLGRRTLLFAAALPLAFAGNVARIASIILAGHWGGQAWGLRVHDASGFLVFLVVLGGAIGLTEAIRRFWPEVPAQQPLSPNASIPDIAAAPRRWPWLVWAPLAIALLGGVGVGLLFQRESSVVPQSGLRLTHAGMPAPLPRVLGMDWIGSPVPVSAAEQSVLPPDTGYARMRYRSAQGAEVFLGIVLSGQDRSSIHRPEICLVAQGWTIHGKTRHTLRRADGTPLEITLLETRTQVDLANGGQREVRALYAYWFVGAQGTEASHGGRMLQGLWDRLRGTPSRWAYITLQTIEDGSREQALGHLEAVFQATEGSLKSEI